MIKKFKRYLAKKLLPYVETTPIKCETTSLDIETVSAVVTIPIGLPMPGEVIKDEVVYELSNKLANYVTFETFEDSKRDQVCFIGTISIVKER